MIYINLGVISYEISNCLKKLKLIPFHRVILTIIEVYTYGFIIANMHFELFGTFFLSILLTIIIALTFSNMSYTSKIFKSKIFEKLGRFGFIMYLTNIPVRTYMLNKYFGQLYNYNKILVEYFIYVIILSIICYIITELIFKNKKENPDLKVES